MATAFDDLIPPQNRKAANSNAFADLIPAPKPQPSVIDRAESAVSNAFHAVTNFLTNSPADQIVARNQKAGKPQPDAFGSVSETVPDPERAAAEITSPSGGAFRRSAGRSVIPTVAGAGGFGAGFATGGTITAPAEAIPVAGPFINGLGALVGGLIGAYGASDLAGAAQQKVISALPGTVQTTLGQDAAQQAADAQQHPTATFAGGLAPSLLLMRPSLSVAPVAEDAPMLTRFLAHPATGAAIGGTLMGGQEAAREELGGEELDPEKIAIATGVGATMNHPTGLGSKLFEGGGNAAIFGLQRAARGAGLVREAFTGPEARQPFDVNATATPVAPEPAGLLPAPDVPPPEGREPPAPEPVEPTPPPAPVPPENAFSDLVPNQPAAQVPPEPASAEPQLAAVVPSGGELGQTLPVRGHNMADFTDPQGVELREGKNKSGAPDASVRTAQDPDGKYRFAINYNAGDIGEGQSFPHSPQFDTREEAQAAGFTELSNRVSLDETPYSDTTKKRLARTREWIAEHGGAPDPNAKQPAPAPFQIPEEGATPEGANAFADLVPPEPKAEPAPAPEPQAPEPTEPVMPSAREPSRFELARDVRTPAGNKHPVRMKVVEASELNKASGQLQNRDRTRDATTLQVQNIVGNFEPELLGHDPSSDRGAPIVDENGTVLSGNGRMLAINRVYDEQPEKAEAYRRFIESHHFDTSGMERPVMVRQLTDALTPDQKRQFVVESNKDDKLQLSASEQARSDADYITPELLKTYAGGDLNTGKNADFVKGFMERLTPGEHGPMLDNNRRLTPEGEARIENALVAHAYGKPEMLERMMESADNDIRSITNSLASVAPRWARMREAAKAGDIPAKLDITDDLMAAAERVSEAKRKGEKPADILSQIDAFNPMPPAQAELIRGFYNKGMTKVAGATGPNGVTEFLSRYIDAAESETGGDGLFGEEEPRDPDALLRAALAKRDNPNGSGLFESEADYEPAREAQRAEGRHHQGGREEEASRPATEGEDGQLPSGGSDGTGRGEPARGSRRGSANRGDQDALDGHQPPERGGYQPSFEEASFTNRQSAYSSAIQALGMDEDKFNLLPPKRKAKLLADALNKLTGIRVEVAPNMPLQFAVDQMLDAHQTLQGMADVLGIAPRALSLGGTLKLKLLKGANFLGVYSNATKEISLPQRSNSFSHEWGHALDYYLLDKYTDGEFTRGLSGYVRDKGGDFTPTNVRDAFVHLMNTMFFDGADIAAKVMRLNKAIEETKSAKQKAALQKQVDNILSGRSRAKEKSRYWQGANAMNKGQGDGTYWTRPTEMLARSFEAWVSFKLANAGLGTEFVGKGNDNYLSDSEKRFQLTFPKGDERIAIFDAFQSLMDTLNAQQAVESAPGGVADVRAASGFNDVATPEQQREANAARNRLARRLNPFARDLEAVDAWFHNRAVDKEEDARRAADPLKLMQRVNNARAICFSAAADGVKQVANRWGSKTALKIHDQFANDLGGSRFVDRTWTDAIEMAVNKALNPVFDEIERMGGAGWFFKKLTREQNDTLSALMHGKDVADDMGLTKLASIMRKAFNDVWYLQRNAGISLGYVNDAGYLNRQIDRELVAGNPDGFTDKARQVYEHVFDRDVGEDADAIAANPEALDDFIDLARRFGVEGYKELRKMLREGGEEGADQGDISELVGEMYDAVRAGFADLKAGEYRDAILHTQTFTDHTAAGSLTDSEKVRTLPAQADELLRDFYNPSPVSSLVNYTHNAVRRSEWNKRFGKPAGAKKSAPTIQSQLDEQMSREGVPAQDRALVWNMVDRMSGRYRRTGLLANPAIVSGLGFLRVKGTLGLMGRAVTLSFFEPASLGIVTGRPIDGIKAVAKTWAGIIRKGNREEMMHWGRAQGFIKHHLLEQFQAMDRFGTTADQPTRWDRYPAMMFRNTGLTALTHISDAAVVDVGRRGVLNELAHRIIDARTHTDEQGRAVTVFSVRQGAGAREAANFARELGIRDPEAFARRIVELNDALPGDDFMNSPEGFDYNTALMRLSRYTIQKPAPAEVAAAGRNPLAAYATYSITAFIQSSYRNLFKRNVIKGMRLLKEGEYEMLTRYVLGTLASVGVLYGLQFLSSVMREYLFNYDREKKWEHDGTWWQNNAGLAAQRTFSFAWGDSIINAFTGLRYNRSLALLPLGAYAGNDIQNIQKMLSVLPSLSTTAPFFKPPSQSRKNNTGEYNAIQGAWNFAGGPLVAGAIQAAPTTGPIGSVLAGLATSTVTGPVAANKIAEAAVGPKAGSIGPDGKKIKGQPTAYDRGLNDLFGKVERKKKGA